MGLVDGNSGSMVGSTSGRVGCSMMEAGERDSTKGCSYCGGSSCFVGALAVRLTWLLQFAGLELGLPLRFDVVFDF